MCNGTGTGNGTGNGTGDGAASYSTTRNARARAVCASTDVAGATAACWQPPARWSLRYCCRRLQALYPRDGRYAHG